MKKIAPTCTSISAIALISLRRIRIALALGIALGASSLHASAKNGDGRKDDSTPFISETRVVAPRQVGDFELVSHRYDPQHKPSGVMLRYEHRDLPQYRIDLFVFPAGKMDADEAVSYSLRTFRASLKPAADAGVYKNVEEGEVAEFDIELPSNEDATPENDDSVSKTRDASKEHNEIDEKYKAMEAELLSASRRLDGQRMSLNYDYRSDIGDQYFPMRSRAYLFYRHLYHFKGRISVAESAADEATYAKFADDAMRVVIPAVQAYNIGSCGNTTIYVNTDAPKEEAADQLMRGVIESNIYLTTSNCHTKSEDAVFSKIEKNAIVETIKYTASDWGGK